MKKFIHILIIFNILLLTGCVNKTNIEKPYKISSEINDNYSEEIEDDFDDEFKEEDTDTNFDPLYYYNSFMTTFNDTFYVYIFNPTAKGYNYIVPKEGRKSIKNFFHNILYPIRLINNILQGKFVNASEETGRFLVNTTVGLFGFFDPAKEYLRWQPHNEDFGQTLGFWGVGSGYHIVLPFFGPSNIRDMFSMYPDSLTNPINYYTNEPILVNAYKEFNNNSLKLGEYENLKKDAIELYPFLKDIYEQRRKKLIQE